MNVFLSDKKMNFLFLKINRIKTQEELSFMALSHCIVGKKNVFGWTPLTLCNLLNTEDYSLMFPLPV